MMINYFYDERGLCVQDGVCVSIDWDKNKKYYESIYGPVKEKALIFPEDIIRIKTTCYTPQLAHGTLEVMEVSDNLEEIYSGDINRMKMVVDFRIKDHITGEYIYRKKYGGNEYKQLLDYQTWNTLCEELPAFIAAERKKNKTQKTAPASGIKSGSNALQSFIAKTKIDIPDEIQKLKVDKIHGNDGTTECVPEVVKFILAEYYKVWMQLSVERTGSMSKYRTLDRDLPAITENASAAEALSLLKTDEFIEYLKSRIEGNFYRLVLIPFVKYAKDSDITALAGTINVKKKGNAKDKIWAEIMTHAIAGRLKNASENAMSGSETSGKTKAELTEELLKTYYCGRVIKGQDWMKNYLSKPELKAFAESLVWSDMHDKTFISKSGEIINSSGAKYVPYGDVKIANVIEMEDSDIDQWKSYFDKVKIKQPFEQINEKRIDLSNLKKLEDMFNGQNITDKQRNTLRKNLKALFVEYEVDDAKKEYDYSAGKYVFSNRNTMHLGKCVDIDYVSNGDKTITFERVHIVSRNARVLNRIISELKDL